MLSPFKNFFHYSNSERKGTVFLLFVLIIVLCVYSYINWFPNNTADKNPYLKEYVAFSEAMSQPKNTTGLSDSLFVFNPNTIGVNEWKTLGFSQKQAQSIEKYKEKGAVFYCKEDIKKLFVVDDEKYSDLAPFIDLPECQNKTYKTNSYDKNKYSTAPKDSACVAIFLKDSTAPLYKSFTKMTNIFYAKKEGVYSYYQLGFATKSEAAMEVDLIRFPSSKVMLLDNCKKMYPVVVYEDFKKAPVQINQTIYEINTVDSVDLLKIKGIWPTLAGRIIKYRNVMGGFLNLYQLHEVFGLTDEVYTKIAPFLKCDPNLMQKININTADLNTLSKHPYIGKQIGNSIFLIRKNHGLYKSIEDIKKSDLINEELFSKIAPYLKIE